MDKKNPPASVPPTDDPFGEETALPPAQVLEDVPASVPEDDLFNGLGEQETDEPAEEDDFDEQGERLLENGLGQSQGSSQEVSIVVTEPLFDVTEFRDRIAETTNLHKQVTQEVSQNLGNLISGDPGMALAFLKQSTENLVKMMDVSRKISESAARSQAFLANLNKGKRPMRPAKEFGDQVPANSPQGTPQIPPGPGTPSEPAPVSPPQVPSPVPGDLSASRFRDLDT